MSQSAHQPKVVREMDVYISDELDLYLLQFPLRPAKAGVPRISNAKFKPKHNVLELGVDHETRERGDSIKMTSTVVASNRSLGVGVLQDGALHITPLQSVIQMRPSVKEMQSTYVPPSGGLEGMIGGGGGVEHLKPNPTHAPIHVKEEENINTNKRRQAVQNSDDESEYGPDDDDSDNEETEGGGGKGDEMLGIRSPVVPLRKENDRQQNTRLMSYAHHSQGKDGESFNTLDVYPQDHSLTSEEFEKLFYNADTDRGGKDTIINRLQAARDIVKEAEEERRLNIEAERDMERRRQADVSEHARQIANRMESNGTLAKSQATLFAEEKERKEKEEKAAKSKSKVARKPRVQVQVTVKGKKSAVTREGGVDKSNSSSSSSSTDKETGKETGKAPVKKKVKASVKPSTKTRSGSTTSNTSKGSKEGTATTRTRSRSGSVSSTTAAASLSPQPVQMLNDIYNTGGADPGMVLDNDGDELVYGRETYNDNEQDEA